MVAIVLWFECKQFYVQMHNVTVSYYIAALTPAHLFRVHVPDKRATNIVHTRPGHNNYLSTTTSIEALTIA